MELSILQIMILENEVKDIGASIMDLHKSYKNAALNEAVGDFFQQEGDIDFMFDEAKKRYQAAKRGLALSNKLQDPAQRKQHASRIMGNLNRLRAIFRRLEASVNATIEQAQNGSSREATMDTSQQRFRQPQMQGQPQPSV